MSVEYREQPSHRRRAALKQVHDPTQRDERPRQHRQVHAEGHERSNRDGSPDRESSAESQHHDSAQPREQHERRVHRGVEAHQIHVPVEILLAHGAKALGLGILLPVRAHDAHARQILLRHRRHMTEILLHRFESTMDLTSEYRCGDGQENHW